VTDQIEFAKLAAGQCFRLALGHLLSGPLYVKQADGRAARWDGQRVFHMRGGTRVWH
jgi:hypothetical protein